MRNYLLSTSPVICFALLTSTASATVYIYDNTTTYLSAALTSGAVQSHLSSVIYSGSQPAAGTDSTALFVIDQDFTDNNSWNVINSGRLNIESGKTLTFQGDSNYTDAGFGLGYGSPTFAITGSDSTAKLVIDGTNPRYRAGGAIYLTSGSLKLAVNTTLSNNRSSAYSNGTAYGGGIYLSAGTTLSITEHVDFTNNQAGLTTANGFGGGIYASGNFEISGSATFTGNKAGFGAAIATNAVGTNTIKNSTFTDNVALYRAGAIYSAGLTYIQDSTFTGNSTGTDSGGAIYYVSNGRDKSLNITDSSFTKNTAKLDGGAIYVTTNSEVYLNVSTGKTSTFSGNLAVDGTKSNSIALTDGANLYVNTADGGVLDMRDPVAGRTVITSVSDPIDIYKTGAGMWKLGGENFFVYASNSSFNVNEGTLYLYKAGEVANASSQNGAATVEAGTILMTGSGSTFNLGANGTVQAGGVNSISAAGNIILAGGGKIKGGTGNTQLTLSAASVVVGASANDVVSLDAGTGDSLTLVAQLSGPGSIMKTGLGTVTVYGAGTFSSRIIAEAGVLDLSPNIHSINGAAFVVGLTASDSGSIVFSASQTFSGNTMTLDFGSLNLASIGNGKTWDLLGSSDADFTSVDLLAQSLVATLTKTDTNVWTYDNGAGLVLTFDQSSGLTSLSSPVPEPATAAALVGLLALSFTATRRRRHNP